MKIVVIGLFSLLVLTSVGAYERFTLKVGETKEGATYYTDDGKIAMFLTLKERRIIERILKPHIWSDSDYDQKIDDKFIKRHTGGCGQCKDDVCAYECKDCSDDAKLFKIVVNDFKGKIVRDMFTKLNLRNDL